MTYDEEMQWLQQQMNALNERAIAIQIEQLPKLNCTIKGVDKDGKVISEVQGELNLKQIHEAAQDTRSWLLEAMEDHKEQRNKLRKGLHRAFVIIDCQPLYQLVEKHPVESSNEPEPPPERA